MEDVGMQCVVEHGVERHLPYVVCVENEGCCAWYCHSAWCRASPAYVVYVKNGRCGAWYSLRAWCGALRAICCVCKIKGFSVW